MQVEVIVPTVNGMLNVLKACVEANVKRVVYVSFAAALMMNPMWSKNQVLEPKDGFFQQMQTFGSQDDEVVAAEGHWQCQEPKVLVNGLSFGPNAVKVFVDVVHEPETFLWRPT